MIQIIQNHTTGHYKKISKMNKISTFLKTLIILTLITFISCQKENSSNSSLEELNSQGKVQINIGSISIAENNDDENEDISSKKASSQKSTDIDHIQEQTIELDDKTKVTAILSPANKASSNKIAGTKTIVDLTSGVKYKLIVYNKATGAYVTERDYTRGSESSTTKLMLDGAGSYTFIAYSFNNTTTIPSARSYSNISLAKLNSISSELLYFKQDIQLFNASTNLNIVLKHQFSQVTATFELSSTTLGSLFSVIPPTFSGGTYSSGNLNLATGELTYNTPTPGTQIGLTSALIAGSQRSLTAQKTLLIGPASTNSSITIPAITLKEASFEYT